MARTPTKAPKFRKDEAKVARYGDHQVITPSYNLKTFARKVDAAGSDEPFDMSALARAEEALANLAGEFDAWMADEVARLRAAHAALAANTDSRDALYRVSHDIRGGAATYGYPLAGEIADSLCRLLDGSEGGTLPERLVKQHVDAITAVVREKASDPTTPIGQQLARELRSASDAQIIAQGGQLPE